MTNKKQRNKLIGQQAVDGGWKTKQSTAAEQKIISYNKCVFIEKI